MKIISVGMVITNLLFLYGVYTETGIFTTVAMGLTGASIAIINRNIQNMSGE